VDILVTDSGLPPQAEQAIREQGVDVILAGTDGIFIGNQSQSF